MLRVWWMSLNTTMFNSFCCQEIMGIRRLAPSELCHSLCSADVKLQNQNRFKVLNVQMLAPSSDTDKCLHPIFLKASTPPGVCTEGWCRVFFHSSGRRVEVRASDTFQALHVFAGGWHSDWKDWISADLTGNHPAKIIFHKPPLALRCQCQS